MSAFVVVAPAQTSRTNDAPGRYLFIVDTSAAMRRRAENTQKAVSKLLLSGLNGQLRAGDTIGLWTFNEELRAGEFPLKNWTPQGSQLIAMSTVEFLKTRQYEKKSRLETVLPQMARVVKDSGKITILLISDGHGGLAGTPFDAAIAEAWKAGESEQRKLDMPFITVLRARRGEFTGYKVNLAPWPVEFPAFPQEAKIAEVPPEAKEPETTLQTNAAPTVGIVATNSETPPVAAVIEQPTPPPTNPAEIVYAPVTNPLPPTPLEAPVPQPVIESNPPLVATPSVATAPVTSAKTQTEETNPVPVQAQSPPSVPTLPASSSDTAPGRNWLLYGGVALLAVALFLILLLVRRSRNPPKKISLITRSLEKDDRPRLSGDTAFLERPPE